MLLETDFVMQHRIKVSLDPDAIERECEADDPNKIRFQRMYQEVVSNDGNLRKVFLFFALAEHDYQIEGSEYQNGAYTERIFQTSNFGYMLLFLIGDSMNPEDRRWLMQLIKEYHVVYQKIRDLEQSINKNDSRDIKEPIYKKIANLEDKLLPLSNRIDEQLDPLRQSFKSEYQFWDYAEDMGTHKHVD